MEFFQTTELTVPLMQIMLLLSLSTIILIIWLTLVQNFLYSRFLKKWLRQLDKLTPLLNQTRRDSWAAIRDLLYVNLKESNGLYSLSQVLGEHATVKQIHDRGSKEIREALKELSGLAPDDDAWFGEGPGPVPYWANTDGKTDEKGGAA